LNFLDQYKIYWEFTMGRARLAPLLFLAFFGFDAHASEPIVHTQYGDVRGVSEGQVESFKNLPFAAPPVGKLRWMPPVEPKKWDGIRDASHFSSKCSHTKNNPLPNHESPPYLLMGNEDCLYLNVFKPSGARDLPVIVFIHGGSLVDGSASETSSNPPVAVYDGSRLAEGAHVVVVTLNYRLGPLGFLVHWKLSEASPYHGSGNYGYLDQIQALQWVHNNIAAFGGDPQNVTLFGHSAGATSVWVHISSPLSKGLFHRAIVDSGVEYEAKTLHESEPLGDKLSLDLNCSKATDELACMRDKSTADIFRVLPEPKNLERYDPVIDHFVLMGSPIAIMRSGMHNHVPIIQGNVEEEMSVFDDEISKKIWTEEDFKSKVTDLLATIPDASLEDVLKLYKVDQYNGSFRKAYNAIDSDRKYICTSRRVLRALSKSQPEFFVGRFFYTHTNSDGPFVYYGATHGFELYFIFDAVGAQQFLPTADEAGLVKVFQDTWGAFAKTGVPTLPAPLPSWKRYNPEEDNYLKFDTRISTDRHHSKLQCDYWDRLSSTPD
jgi:para-nitrobenzyl esterase